MKKLSKKLAGVVAVGLSITPGAMGAVTTVLNTPVAHAEENKQVDVKATATIADSVAKGNTGNVFSQAYNLNLTVPDTVKSGSTVSITVDNLPLLFGSGSVSSADVTVDNVVIGKITLKKSVNQRNQQINTKTSLDQKKSEKITAGGGHYEYELVFNEKAEGYKNKEVTFKSSTEGNVFTAVSKDVTVPAKITVNNKEVAKKDVTIKPSPKQDTKTKPSTIDLSTNTQITNSTDGSVKYFLGLGIRPLDQDYGVGTKITVNLPKDSMMSFEKGDVESKEISIIPSFNSDSFANENGVYLADVNPVKVAVAEMTKDKVVFEVKEGTLKRVQYYVINSENTPISFRLTEKSAGKLSADGKTFGPETITSSITTKEGKVNATDVNSSSIRVNGAAMTAKGVQDLINKPTKPAEKKSYTTRWITMEGDKEVKLKEDVKGDKIMDPDKFDNYKLIKTKTDTKENVTTYVYEKIKTYTTDWVEEVVTKDDQGKEVKSEIKLKDQTIGEKVEEAGKFDGFTFVRTDTDKDGNVKHVFKKTDSKKVTTTWVEEVTSKDKDGKEVKTEKELKKPLVADKAGEAGTFEGYTFVRTDTDKSGNVKHVFKKGDTKTPDKKTAVNTGAAAGKFILPVLGLSGLGGGIAYLAKRKSKK